MDTRVQHISPERQVRERDYQFYDFTVSLCNHCLRRVDAKIVFADGAVWMLKRCPEHGAQKVMIADDIDYYQRARELFVKTPEQVQRYNTPSRYGCPYDCGICPDHEQHGCVLLIEITDRCNLRCPTCYANSSPDRLTHRSLAQIEAMLDRAVANEGEPNIVQLSGGEPTLHPEFFEVMKLASERPIGHLMINTNGVRIARDPSFAERIALEYPETEIYLQFDSLKSEALLTLRGEDLTHVRQQALERLNQLGLATTLVVTVRRGVNDDQLGEILEFARQQPCVRGVNLQPVQVAGRLEEYPDGYQQARDRLTLTEVRRKVLQQSPLFTPEDIIPVPCHSDSLAMAYALKTDQQLLPLTSLVDPQLLINAGRNTIVYEKELLQGRLFDLFSTAHSPNAQGQSLKQFLSVAAGTPNKAFNYQNVFRLLIVEFIDAYSFDLRSIRKTCVHIVHPDGKRVIPFDTYNLLYRDELEQELLAPLRDQQTGLNGPISLNAGAREQP